MTAQCGAGGASDERTDWSLPELGFESEVEYLRVAISNWIETAEDEMRPALRWQFLSGSKYFRPLTMFCCYRAVHDRRIPEETISDAMVLELMHNMTLIVDDILDKSEERRGKSTLHTKFGELPALMTSGYLVAEAFRRMSVDARGIELLAELMTRLGVAECMQWRLRQRPLGVEDWRHLAREDTGSMFEIAACLGDRSENLRKFGQLLGILYHGCDDVSDVRGSLALGGGGDEDIRDGILTLPAAIAIRDEEIAAKFECPTPDNYDDLARAFVAALPVAEQHLDDIAREARKEAVTVAANPGPLLALVDQTRRLSQR